MRWPNRGEVDAAVRQWGSRVAARRPDVRALGYFGSYARGDWGVGSDLDLVAVIDRSAEPFHRRALSWELSELPVPADLLVYTEAEWGQLQGEGRRLAKVFADEVEWVFTAAGFALGVPTR